MRTQDFDFGKKWSLYGTHFTIKKQEFSERAESHLTITANDKLSEKGLS
jgi:hypothetical protein